MIEPYRKDEALLAELRAPVDEAQVHLWWLGQSGFVLRFGGQTLVIDPYLSDALTAKYAGTDREHVRLTTRCMAPDDLDMVDLAFSTHAHTDHCDLQTLVPMGRAVRRRGRTLPLILPAAQEEALRARTEPGLFRTRGVDAGEHVEVAGVRVDVLAAAHPTVERDAAGRCRFLGYLIQCGRWRVLHSGDTLWHEELLPRWMALRPDVVLLPINGDRPERGVAGNLNGTEAAALARACGARVAIPHHFEMFAFNTDTPDEFREACRRLGQHCRVLRCGERWSTAELE